MGEVDIQGGGGSRGFGEGHLLPPSLRGTARDTAVSRGDATLGYLAGRAFGAARIIAELPPVTSTRLNLFQALLPPGLAWPRDDDAELTAVLDGLSRESQRVDERADTILLEMNPATAVELLPDWERICGLSDNAGLSTAERQAAVVAKLVARGRQDPAFFISLAATVGYTITLEFPQPFTCNSRAGDSLTQGDWVFVMIVHTAHGANDALLQSTIVGAAQDHILVQFQYS